MTVGRMRRGAIAAAILSMSVLAACSQSSSESTPAAAGGTAPPQESAPAPGTHRVVGKSPPAVSGMPSVIILEPREPRELSSQGDRPAMDQLTQTFVPSVLFVRTGQPTDFKNSDDVLHNVRVRNADTKEGTFNVAIPTGQIYTHSFDKDGFYDVGCDIHPGMSAQIIATTTPYAALADADGTFVFENVEPGTYKVTIFSGAARQEKTIDVAAAVTTVGE